MTVLCNVRKGEYHDSITLMQTARHLIDLEGVIDAAVVMATEANQAILKEAGLLLPEIEAATANDLVVAVKARDAATAQAALDAAQVHLAQRPEPAGGGGAVAQPRSVRAAARSLPGANLALISVAGRYAVAEAWEALHSGLHVLLFSDNVDVEDELALKRYAVEHGLLMMGPGCGTALIDGVALGFANAVPRGPVGIVAAAGTGLQEVSTLLARLGVGITQGIGTGGRDLHAEVGGLTMLQGIRRLQSDPDTEVLLLLSKPPDPDVVQLVLDQLSQDPKPAVVCFLGGDSEPVAAAGATPARTLQEAAYRAAEAAGLPGLPARQAIAEETGRLEVQAAGLRQRMQPGQRYLRGLFSGGTLAAEALVIWETALPGVRSNVAVDPRLRLQDATHCEGHCAVDLGEDEFTVGRPHPMIDNDLRVRRLLQEAADPQVALILLDVVLGYGAHPDPASELGPAVRQAREQAAAAGRDLLVVASVTGTEEDPQRLSRQVQALEEAGVVVCSSNAAAARLAAFVVNSLAQHGARSS